MSGPASSFVLRAGAAVLLNGFSSDSSSDEEEPPTKKLRSAREFNAESRRKGVFNQRYLLSADNCTDHEGPESIWNESSRLGKKFRQRFRLPYKMFDHICRRYSLEGDPRAAHDGTKKEKADVRLLALGTFRQIARDLTFDDLEDLNGISKTANRAFFKLFIPWLASLAPEHIKLPMTAQEIEHVTNLYRRLGIPGCVGSVDCVHVFWDKCPANLQSRCKGKDKFPSLVFEVIASHTKKILSISSIQYGTDNDKTISHSDAAIRRIRQDGDILKDSSFTYYKSDGSEGEATGLFYICDGGYNSWIQLVAPFKHEPEGKPPALWSNHIESVRKDIECVFGILKRRFLILKHPVRLQGMDIISDLFVACGVLHNMLIDWDGNDDWEERVEFQELEEAESDIEDDGEVRRDASLRRGRAANPLERVGLTRHRLRQQGVVSATDDDNATVTNDDCDEGENNGVAVSSTAKQAYLERRQMLVKHYEIASKKGEVKWY